MARAQITMPEFLADPFGSLARARRQGWLADFGLGLGAVTYGDVRTLLTDARLRASFTDFLRGFGITSGPFHDWMAMSPLNRDGPEHNEHCAPSAAGDEIVQGHRIAMHLPVT